MSPIGGIEKKKPLPSKISNKLSSIEESTIIMLATRNYPISTISTYLRRSQKIVARVISRSRDTICQKQMNEILTPLESTALDKALIDKDSLMIRFLLSKYRPEMYGDKLEVSATSNPSKIRIKSTSGKLLESINKPEDQS